METTIEYTDRNRALVSTDEVGLRNHLLKYAEQNTDNVEILAMPETNDGCLCMWVPVSWIRIKPPKQMSEERKQQMAEVLRKAREKREDTDVSV